MATNDDTLRLVRRYHNGWSSKAFSDAVGLLSPSLKVETPINDYPTTEAFAKAVIAFAGMTKRVSPLAEFANDSEAILLYDMEVEGLGSLRVAEHFTVAGGKIVRIRQIHDTAALRKAGFDNAGTKDTIEGYFISLKQKSGWEAFLSDDIVFTSFTSPIKRVTGRTAFLESTARFYSMIAAVEVRDLMIAGPRACALTRYQLQPPGGAAFASEVAEIFRVQDGKINALDIYFDSAPFPKR